jgi:hypothetical protein
MSGYVHALMARVFDHAHVVELAQWSSVPVINGLSDFSHPCQAMADAQTIIEKFGTKALPEIVVSDVSNRMAGTIDRLEIISGGIDYVDGDAAVTIVGDGSGAEAIIDIDPDDGSILSVTITERGTGYTFAEVTISGAEGTGAEIIAVISPRAGHGANPQKELFATNVGFSVNLTNESADLFLNNDFRQIGVVKNPLILNVQTVQGQISIQFFPIMSSFTENSPLLIYYFICMVTITHKTE